MTIPGSCPTPQTSNPPLIQGSLSVSSPRYPNCSLDSITPERAAESKSFIFYISSICNYPTYLFCHLLCHLIAFCESAYILIRPLECIYNLIMQCYDSAYYFIASRFATPELDFSKNQQQQMQKTYWALSSDKWMEGFERGFQQYGPLVFDMGLHGGPVEFGFNRSWNRAVHFLSHQFQNRVSAEMYLALHRIACGHFCGKANNVLTDQEGEFRGEENSPVEWVCKDVYLPTEEAIRDLETMNQEVQARFGTPLAQFVNNNNNTATLSYQHMSQDKVRSLYNYFCVNLNAELERAQNAEEKLVAICKFYRNSEWLHSVQDGCGRCDLMMLNFLLTQQGFHPVIMNSPYLASTRSLPNWVEIVREGLRNWETAKESAQARLCSA